MLIKNSLPSENIRLESQQKWGGSLMKTLHFKKSGGMPIKTKQRKRRTSLETSTLTI